MEKKRKRSSSFSSENSSFKLSGISNSFSSARECSGKTTDSEISGLRNKFSNKKFKISDQSQNSSQTSTYCDQLAFEDFSQNLESFSSQSTENQENLGIGHSTPKRRSRRASKHVSKYKIDEEQSTELQEIDLNSLPFNNPTEKVEEFLNKFQINDIEAFQTSNLNQSNATDISIMSTEKLNVDFISTQRKKLDISIVFASSPSSGISKDTFPNLDSEKNDSETFIFDGLPPSKSTEETDFLEINSLKENSLKSNNSNVFASFYDDSDSEFDSFFKNYNFNSGKEFPNDQVFNICSSKNQEATASSSKGISEEKRNYDNPDESNDSVTFDNTLIQEDRDSKLNNSNFGDASFPSYNSSESSITNLELNAFDMCPKSNPLLAEIREQCEPSIESGEQSDNSEFFKLAINSPFSTNIGEATIPREDSNNSNVFASFYDDSDSEFDSFLKNYNFNSGKEFPNDQVFNICSSKNQEATASSSKEISEEKRNYDNPDESNDSVTFDNTLIQEDRDSKLNNSNFGDASFPSYNSSESSITNLELNAFDMCPKSNPLLAEIREHCEPSIESGEQSNNSEFFKLAINSPFSTNIGEATIPREDSNLDNISSPKFDESDDRITFNAMVADLPLKFDASPERALIQSNEEQIPIFDFDEGDISLPSNNPPESPVTNLEPDVFNISSRSTGTLSTGSKENLNETDKNIREGMNRITSDKSLIYTGPAIINETRQTKEVIMSKLYGLIQQVIVAAQNKEPKVFEVRNPHKWNNYDFVNGSFKLKDHQTAQKTIISYDSRKSRLRFALILRLLCKMYSLLKNNSICTQREIYYQMKDSVKDQTQIRLAMNTISSILEVEPWYLPIVSTSKGLVYGNLSIVISSKEIIHCNSFGGTLVPQDVTRIKGFRSKAYFILVVEKDAIFKKLLDEDVPTKFTRPFILVTGKGFPDINTRLFVKKLWMTLRIPVFTLVDADVYGIDIMLTYRFGSRELAHVAEELAIPKIKWLGVLPSDFAVFNITNKQLDEKEKDKLKQMLKRPYVDNLPWLKKELNIMLEKNCKAEIEGVMKNDNYLTNFYLMYKFCNQNYF